MVIIFTCIYDGNSDQSIQLHTVHHIDFQPILVYRSRSHLHDHRSLHSCIYISLCIHHQTFLLDMAPNMRHLSILCYRCILHSQDCKMLRSDTSMFLGSSNRRYLRCKIIHSFYPCNQQDKYTVRLRYCIVRHSGKCMGSHIQVQIIHLDMIVHKGHL